MRTNPPKAEPLDLEAVFAKAASAILRLEPLQVLQADQHVLSESDIGAAADAEDAIRSLVAALRAQLAAPGDVGALADQLQTIGESLRALAEAGIITPIVGMTPGDAVVREAATALRRLARENYRMKDYQVRHGKVYMEFQAENQRLRARVAKLEADRESRAKVERVIGIDDDHIRYDLRILGAEPCKRGLEVVVSLGAALDAARSQGEPEEG